MKLWSGARKLKLLGVGNMTIICKIFLIWIFRLMFDNIKKNQWDIGNVETVHHWVVQQLWKLFYNLKPHFCLPRFLIRLIHSWKIKILNSIYSEWEVITFDQTRVSFLWILKNDDSFKIISIKACIESLKLKTSALTLGILC